MSKISYLQKVPVIKYFLGILFGIAILITQSFVFGFLLLGVGLNLVSSEGTELDLESKTYRKTKSVLGFKFGKWKTCPNFDYISVFKTTEKQRINGRTATANLKSEQILVNLFYAGNKNFTFYKTKDQNEAFEVAAHIKLALEIAILDATSSEKKWL